MFIIELMFYLNFKFINYQKENPFKMRLYYCFKEYGEKKTKITNFLSKY